jgi:hypothetical protein
MSLKGSKSKRKNPKSNPNSFKLSLLETSTQIKEVSKNLNKNQLNVDEEAELLQYLMEKDNSKKVTKFNQNTNIQRGKSLKKNSLGGNSPLIKKENSSGSNNNGHAGSVSLGGH